jgi:hypothetical protein
MEFSITAQISEKEFSITAEISELDFSITAQIPEMDFLLFQTNNEHEKDISMPKQHPVEPV